MTERSTQQCSTGYMDKDMGLHLCLPEYVLEHH
jgi:hypothetical protein